MEKYYHILSKIVGPEFLDDLKETLASVDGKVNLHDTEAPICSYIFTFLAIQTDEFCRNNM